MEPFRLFRKICPLPGRLLLLLPLLSLTAASCDESAAVEDTVHAFTNVNLLPMTHEQVLENQTVLVRDGIIADLGPADEITVPAGAVTIDGSGRYLMPGLAEM